MLAAGMFIALAALFFYDGIGPGASKVSPNQVKALVASAMASATPPPSIGSQVFQQVFPSVVRITTHVLTTNGKSEGSLGSGVILDDTGTILTNYHVVQDAVDITVTFYDGTQSPAFVYTKQPENDIAVLRPQNLPAQVVPATLGSPDSLSVGDQAFVLGNPYGITDSFSAGVISGLNRNFKSPKTGQTLSNLIQFDAAANPGNSGGPLLNRDGEVVGIVTAILNPTDQDVFIGIGFAIPIQTAAGAAGSPPD